VLPGFAGAVQFKLTVAGPASVGVGGFIVNALTVWFWVEDPEAEEDVWVPDDC